ncbi:MAG: hypothetical protein HDR71_02780 [Lachnospiraceae bacterium]|nr:hypothetical protein [Lachnospiraceae bacterium]
MKRNIKTAALIAAVFLALPAFENQNGINIVNAGSDNNTREYSPQTPLPSDNKSEVPVSKSETAPVPETIPIHSHNFQYMTIQEASETQDAVILIRCSCGITNGTITEPGSALNIFIEDIIRDIANAPENGTVTAETKIWICYNKAVMDALLQRPDVTLVTNYRYNNVDYTVTIPAGYEADTLLDENGYCGFRYLDKVFGGSEVTA